MTYECSIGGLPKTFQLRTIDGVTRHWRHANLAEEKVDRTFGPGAEDWAFDPRFVLDESCVEVTRVEVEPLPSASIPPTPRTPRAGDEPTNTGPYSRSNPSPYWDTADCVEAFNAGRRMEYIQVCPPWQLDHLLDLKYGPDDG